MVKGLDLFVEHFKDFQDNYVLIGGTACAILMEEAGADFRATKDFDIVLIAEALNAEFVENMWAFIEEGSYKNKMKGSEKTIFYRFEKPENKEFPFMLEFFSIKPDQLSYSGEGHLTPLPIEEDISSLSAILLDKNYYDFLRQGKVLISDIPVLSTEYLIPFKAKAWIDLTERKKKGDSVDSKVIRKHKNDVFKLALIVEDKPETIPQSIADDMQIFLEKMKINPPDLKALGIREIGINTIIEKLDELYI